VFAFRLLTRVSLLYLEESVVGSVCLKAHKGRATEEEPNCEEKVHRCGLPRGGFEDSLLTAEKQALRLNSCMHQDRVS
jgi:hypothetical protein